MIRVFPEIPDPESGPAVAGTVLGHGSGECVIWVRLSNDFRNGPPGDTRKGPPVFVQRHFRLQSMVRNGSCGVGSVKPPAAFGGGSQGLA